MPTYSTNVDYSDLIAQEAAKGAGANRNLLAQYESQRNAKIDAEGLPYAKTYDYTTRPAGSGWGASDAVGGTGGNGSTSINGSGGVGASGGSVPSGGYYTARDQSEYINQLYDAAVKSAQAALEGAYNEAVLGFDHAEAQIPEQYRAARNQTSADAAVARANMNEQLAASGLNTGASGQARLAMGVAEQNAMAELARQQQAAIDEITLQRNQARAQYESAVAQAIADNDMQRAQALYQEAQRVDNSYRSYLEDALQQQQYQMNQLSMEATRQQMQLAAAADQREQQLLEAELAGYGSSGGSTGGGGGGGSTTIERVDTPSYTPITSVNGLSDAARAIYDAYRRITPAASTYGNVAKDFSNRIANALNSGSISEADADYLLTLLGV